MINRQAIADLWWELMRIPAEEFFPRCTDRIANNIAGRGRVMSPGFVGRQYQPGGCLLVGNYPAGGTDGYVSQENPSDVALYGCFEALRDAQSPEARLITFEQMSQTWIQIQSTHRIYSNLIRHLLWALGVQDQEVAFVNAFPFRCKDNKSPTVEMRRAAWNLALRRQIELLAPGRIVALGMATGAALAPYREQLGPLVILPRSNGDRYLTPEARQIIDQFSARASDGEWPVSSKPPTPSASGQAAGVSAPNPLVATGTYSGERTSAGRPSVAGAKLEEFIDRVQSTDVRAGLRLLIEQGVSGGFSLEARQKGYLSDIRYMTNGEWHFSISVNKQSLLFYVRKPAMSSLGARIGRLRGLSGSSQKSGEIRIPVRSSEDARELAAVVLDRAG